MDTRRYDCVVFAVPPAIWGDIEITPFHPRDVIGLMASGAAVKFFSNVKERFWVEAGLAPLGGSLEIGQVWEGTDNQTRVKGQDIVLSVFTGSRTPSASRFTEGLDHLYPIRSAQQLGLPPQPEEVPDARRLVEAAVHPDWLLLTPDLVRSSRSAKS